MEDKQYDLLLSLVDNGGNASIVDLVDKGMTTDNTSFYDKDTYKNSEVIKEKFTNPTTGEFDDKLFDNVYASAEAQYQKLGILQDVKKADNLFKDNGYLNDAWLKITDNNAYQLSKLGEDRTLTSKYVSVPNPDLVNKSLAERLNYTAESPWSVRELAQMNKVKDSMTGEWMDTPSFFGVEPLVLATYDEEVKDENGNVIHEKGEKKLDEEGHYYYETLGNRSVYGKELLNRWDVVTPDNSLLNKIDFFDSDDKYSKNPIGAVLKTAALVGSMYIPGVGPWIAGLSVLMQTSSMLGTLGKMITGDETSYTLNNLEAFAKQYARDSKTDEAQQSIFSFENIIGLIGEVAAQLKEQRWIFEQTPLLLGKEARLGQEYMLSKEPMKVIDKTSDLIFKERFNKEFAEGVSKLKTGNLEDFKKYISATEMAQKDIVKKFLEEQVKKNTQFSANLSKAYMTFLTTQDAYGEAIHMGIPRYEALGYAAGYTLAEYALLNTGIGERILPELHADRVMMKGMLNTIFKETKETLTKNKALYPEDFIGKKAFSSIFKTAKEKSKKVLDTLLPSYYTNEGVANLGKILWGNAVGEMLEETSEELLADLSKEALTLYRQFQNEDHINMWQNDNWVERYFMSALGGFLGGGMNTALTHASQGFDAIKKFGVFEGTANDAILSIAQDPEQIELMNKVLDQLPIGNSTVSFKLNDKTKQFETTGDYTESQDYIIKESLKNLINYTAKQLKADGAYLSKESFLNAMTEVGRNAFTEAVNLSNLRNTKTLGVQFSHFRELQNRLMNLNADIDDIYNSKSVDSAKLKEDQKLRLQQLTEEKEKVIAELQSYANKEKIYDFAETALFESNEELSKAFKKKNFLNLGHYTEWRFGMDYAKTTQNQKDRAKAEWEAFQDEENPEFILACSDIFKKILKDNQKNIQEALNKPTQQGNETQFESLLNTLSKLNNEFNIDELEKYSNGVNETLNTIFSNLKQLKNQLVLQEKEGISSIRTNYPNNPEYTINLLNSFKRDENLPEIKFNYDKDQKIISVNYNGNNYNIIQYDGSYLEKILDLERLINSSEEELIEWDIEDENNTLPEDQKINILSNIHSFLSDVNNKVTPDQKVKAITGVSYEEEKTKVLKTILNDINNFTSYNPTYYAYAEQVLNQLKPNNEEDQKAVKETLNNLKSKRKEISFQLLENFIDKANSNQDKFTNIFKVLSEIHDYLTYNYELNFDKLRLSKEEIETLKSLNGDIMLLQTLLYAMRNDNADITNIKGYTPLLNNINKALNLGKEPLVEINKDQVDILIQDLNSFTKFIENYIAIDDLNSSAKFKKETAKQVKDITGTFSFMYDTLGDTALGDKEKLKTICPTIFDLVEKIKKAGDDRIYNVPLDILKIIIKEKITLEKHIYDTLNSDLYFDKNLKTFKKESFKALIAKCVPDSLKVEDTQLEIINKDKSWNKFLSYLLRIGSFESSLFYNAYREYLKTNQELAALYEQEINIHTALSTIINSKFINEACDLINEVCIEKININNPNATELKDYKLFFGYKNIVLMQGFPGVGKTMACVKQIIDLMKKSNPILISSSYFAHITEENAKQVTEKIGQNVKPYGKNDLLKLFYNDYDSYPTEGILTEEQTNKLFDITDKNLNLKEIIKPNIITNCPKIIFIDEISKYTEIDLRLLERAALANGFIIIGLGDFDQINTKCDIKADIIYHLTSKSKQFYSAEKISIVIRAENNLIENALNEFQKINDINDIETFNGFNYYESDTEIAGIKYFQPRNFETELNKLLKIRNAEESIMIIANETEFDKIKNLTAGNKNISIKTLIESQGNEADYVIDLTESYGDKKELYTSFSRAKKAALLSYHKINSFKMDSYKKFPPLSEAFIQKTNQARIDQYSDLENKTELGKEHFQPIDKDESLKGTTQTPPPEKNPEGFTSKEEAEEFLNSFKIDQEWKDLNNYTNTVTTSADNFSIQPIDRQYQIRVKVDNTEYSFNDFLATHIPAEEPSENEPSSFTNNDETVPDSKAPGSVLQFYGFNTNFPYPDKFNSNSQRIDNYYGLIKLNPAFKTDKEKAEKALQNVQNYLYYCLLQNIPIDVSRLQTIIGGNNFPEIHSLSIGLTHPEFRTNKEEFKNSVWFREDKVTLQKGTDNFEAPGTHVVFRLFSKEKTNKNKQKMLLEINLGALINPLTLLKTYKNKQYVQDIIAKYPKLNPDLPPSQEKAREVYDIFIGKDLTFYPFLQSKIEENLDPQVKDFLTQFTVLCQIFSHKTYYYNLKSIPYEQNQAFDLNLNVVAGFRNAEYVQSIQNTQWNPAERSLKDYKEIATKEDGIYIGDKVYIAKYDITDDNGETIIPQGTSFILYSFDELSKNNLTINGLKSSPNSVLWYGLTEQPNNNIKDYLAYLEEKQKHPEDIEQHWGNNATSWYITDYIFKNIINYDENHPLIKNLKRYLENSNATDINLDEAIKQFLRFQKLVKKNNIEPRRQGLTSNKYGTEVISFLTNQIGSQNYFTAINSGTSRFYTIFNKTLLNLLTPEETDLSPQEKAELNEAIEQTLTKIQNALENEDLPDIIPQAEIVHTNDSDVLESLMPWDQYIIRGHLQRPTLNSSALKDLLNKLWNPAKLKIEQTFDQEESSPSKDDNKSLTKEEKIAKGKEFFESNCIKLNPSQEITDTMYELFYNLSENKDNNEFIVNYLKTLAENSLILYKFKGKYYVEQILNSATNVEVNKEGQIISYESGDNTYNIEYTLEHIRRCSGYEKVKLYTKKQLGKPTPIGKNLCIQLKSEPKDFTEIGGKEFISEELKIRTVYKVPGLKSNTFNYYYIVDKNTTYDDIIKSGLENFILDRYLIKENSFSVNSEIYKDEEGKIPYTDQELQELAKTSDILEVWQKSCDIIIN